MATNSAANFAKPIGVANGGTAAASFTAYAPLCGGTTSTSAFQTGSTGLSTTGNILTSNGASTLPSWIPAGSLVKLSTQTASSAANILFDNTVISSAYTTYLAVFNNIRCASLNTNFNLRVSTNNGSSFVTSGYQAGTSSNNWNSATVGANNSTTFGLLASSVGGSAGSNLGAGYVLINIPTSDTISFVSKSVWQKGTTLNMAAYGYNSGTTTVNAIAFLGTSGNINGTMTMYGIKQ